MSSATESDPNEPTIVTVVAAKSEVRARGTGSLAMPRQSYVVRIGYREPEYAKRRAIEAQVYSGEFRVSATSFEHAIDKGMEAFREAAALSSVCWRREICSVSCVLAE